MRLICCPRYQRLSRCSVAHQRGAGRQAGEGESRHGHLHHDEPDVRRPLEPPRQPEEAVSQPRDDAARPPADLASDALLPGLPHRRGDRQQGGALLQVSGAAGPSSVVGDDRTRRKRRSPSRKRPSIPVETALRFRRFLPESRAVSTDRASAVSSECTDSRFPFSSSEWRSSSECRPWVRVTRDSSGAVVSQWDLETCRGGGRGATAYFYRM